MFFFKVTFDDWDGAGNDYGLGGGNNAKQLTLRGKDNVAEKVRVWQGPGLFSKDFKVVEVWRIDSKIFMSSRFSFLPSLRSRGGF